MSHAWNADIFLADISDDICSPFFDKSGNMFVILQSSGEILSVSSSGNMDTTHTTGGQPSGACYDQDGIMYISDFAHGSVLAVQPDGQQDVVVGVYEDKPMLGPNSICCSRGSIFFTDSGPFGETGLHSPTGSVFAIVNSPSGQILKPISLGNLAYPSGIAVGNDGSIYVAETMTNRILRFFQQPEGVYHGSVFCQLSGSIGPCGVAIDSAGNLYIAQYETRANADEGTVIVMSKYGRELGRIVVGGPELSGIVVNGKTVYITEKSSKSVYSFAIKNAY